MQRRKRWLKSNLCPARKRLMLQQSFTVILSLQKPQRRRAETQTHPAAGARWERENPRSSLPRDTHPRPTRPRAPIRATWQDDVGDLSEHPRSKDNKRTSKQKQVRFGTCSPNQDPGSLPEKSDFVTANRQAKSVFGRLSAALGYLPPSTTSTTTSTDLFSD